jgi:non-ribosomal peptide synthetase component F
MTSGEAIRQPPAEDVFVFPVSMSQQRLWFIEQERPAQPAYNIPSAVRARGPLDLKVLEDVLREITRRHESLRTHFTVVHGLLHQVISQTGSTNVRIVDLSSLAEKDREAEAKMQAQVEAQTPFDLGRGPLLRVTLFRLREQDHVLLLNLHHIICDGWSMGILMREISVLYEAFSSGNSAPLPELPIQYADYTAWQRERLSGVVLDRQLAYWRRQLAGAKLFKLPIDRPQSLVTGNRAARISFAVPTEVSTSLENIGRQQKATLYMVLVAAFLTLLYRCTGETDLAIGSSIAGRSRPEVEKLIGCFTNLFVLRVDLSGAPTFLELVQRVRKASLEAYEHSDVPFEKLVGIVQTEGKLRRPPVDFVFQNMPTADLHLGPVSLEPFDADSGVAKIDLTLFVGTSNGEMWGTVRYNADLFENKTIAVMFQRFQGLLRGITRNCQDRISDVLIPDATAGALT